MPTYDLFSRRFKADPFPTFARMRDEAPVYAHQAPNGSTIWYITRYDDVTAVLKDDLHFVKNPRHALTPAQLAQTPPRSGAQKLINENMLFSDPPDHTRLRALVNQAFTPRRVERMAGRIQAIADDLLDKAQPQGQMDLIADCALPLPVIVISELLGVPPQDRAAVADWSQAIISPGSRGLNYSARKQRLRAFVAYLRDLFAARQRDPRDDLTTALVQAEEAGERLSEEELFSMVALLLVTGHETTVNLIGNGMLALLQHPAQLAYLQANPGNVATAVEELLRYDGPVETSTTRWVGRDCTFRGHHLRRGDVVRAVLASANRDPAHFDNPDALDLTRRETVHSRCGRSLTEPPDWHGQETGQSREAELSPRRDNRHLAFGLGIHYCLGAPLARLEGQLAFNTLLQRLPNLRLAQPDADLAWRSGVLFRCLTRLPLQWEA